MKKAILYQKEECVFIKSVIIADKNFCFFVAIGSKKIIYLKESIVHDRTTYVSLEKLVHLFKEYQNPAIFNTKVLLDTFTNTINYKIRIGAIANSDEILEIIYQFEKIVNDPYIKQMTNPYATIIFNKQAMFEVTNTIKKLDGKLKKVSLADLLKVNDQRPNDVFLSQNWLDTNSNKDYVYEMIKKSNKQHKKSPIDFLFNNRVLNVYMVVIIVAVVGFFSCFDMLAEWKRTGSETQEEIDMIMEEVVGGTGEEEIVEFGQDIEDPIETPVQTSNKSSNKNSSNKNNSNKNNVSKYGADYTNYAKVSFAKIDFNSLKKKNSDTVAWITVNNTNVNYPVVQGKDNSYYLNHSFNKKQNVAGWIYADYRDSFKSWKRNTVIYGHGRTDQVMFGSLAKTIKSDWYKNPDNKYIKLATPKYNTLWQIFSIYVIKQESYYLTVNFENDASFKKWYEKMKSRSIYNFGVSASPSDKFLTLSTCKDYNGNRIVVIGKLVKSVKRG